MYQERRIVRGPVIVMRDVFNRKRQRKGRTRGIGFVTKERGQAQARRGLA